MNDEELILQLWGWRWRRENCYSSYGGEREEGRIDSLVVGVNVKVEELILRRGSYSSAQLNK